MELESEIQAHADGIQELRNRLGDSVRREHDNRALFKWLKARNFDVAAAEEMYRKSLEWRQQVGADTILKDFTVPEVMKKYYPGGLFGVAKNGCPVWIDPMGRGDFRGILCSVSREDIMKSTVYRMELLYEKFRELSDELHRPIDRCVHIIDVEGYGPKMLWKPVLEMYVATLNLMESNYPETLQASFVVNCPRFFKMGFDIIKKFIDSQTASKFIILKHNWQETLLNLIDADQLPVAYGGTRVDESGDPHCSKLICYGGEVPKHFYLDRVNTVFEGKPLIQETIGRRKTFTVQFDAAEEHVALRWGFYTNSGDLWFSVRHVPSSGPGGANSAANHVTGESVSDAKAVVIQEACKYNSGSQPADGLVICDSAGRYLLDFFNPSLVHSRTLSYWVEMVTKDADNVAII